MKINLNGNWQGFCISPAGDNDFSFKATVPGCVHTDLLGQKLPTDIFYRDNTDLCQWPEDCDFTFIKTFKLDEIPTAANLIFEGLDTYADIFLNDTKIGSADNMFISHKFEVKDLLVNGENKITVKLRSPIREVENLEKLSGAFTTERLHTRRIQCTYSWDWVARYVTQGIWRDVYIDCDNDFGIENAYIYTEFIEKGLAQIVIDATLKNYQNGGTVNAEIFDPDGELIYSHNWFRKENVFKEYIDIENPKLWYPLGYGEQPLYTLILCGKKFTFGIRTANIIQTPDKEDDEYYKKCLEIKDTESGKYYDKNTDFSGFLLKVNGLEIMCKGANWVPCEPFPSAESDEKITHILTLAKTAGINMIRVWGGGIFEKEYFYNECDRLGIMVTQDFLMACGRYPDDNPVFITQLQKEAEFAALALRNHPCLMWWSGDNENALSGHDESATYQGRNAIFAGIFPILNRFDPKRRFLLSSPFGGNFYSSKTKGTTHNTNFLGSIMPYIMSNDVSNYKEFFEPFLARFIAEEPTFGAIGLPSLRRFMTDEDIFESDEMWYYHTKNNPFLDFTLFDMVKSFAKNLLGEFKNGKDRLFKLKYVQYEWVRILMENVRRNKGFINGQIFWMLNDCWPAACGWSFIDYYGLPKASYYGFKRCAAPIVASIDKKEFYRVFLSNDTSKDIPMNLKLFVINNSKIRLISDINVIAAANKSSIVATLDDNLLAEGEILLCQITGDGISDRTFYKNGALPIKESNDILVVRENENSITLTASAYVHVVELEGEHIFADNYFPLYPGETRTITFEPTFDQKNTDISVIGYTF